MEDSKQVSNNEILEVVKAMQGEIGEIKSQMVTKDEFETAISKMVTKDVFEATIADLAHSLNFVTQHAATEIQIIESEARLKQEINRINWNMVDRDFVTTKIGELKGIFVEAFKNGDAKSNKIAEILVQREVINESDNNEITGMVPFPRPKMI